MKKTKNKKKTCCPKCGSEDIAHILYGYPAFEKIEEDLYAGKIALGGCCFEADVSPKYHCNDCENDFGIYMRSKASIEITEEDIKI